MGREGGRGGVRHTDKERERWEMGRERGERGSET